MFFLTFYLRPLIQQRTQTSFNKLQRKIQISNRLKDIDHRNANFNPILVTLKIGFISYPWPIIHL